MHPSSPFNVNLIKALPSKRLVIVTEIDKKNHFDVKTKKSQFVILIFFE